MILDGRLAPGQRLPSERALSEALRISRPTVREAIRSLQAMHILESRHGAGTFVASLSVEELLAPLQFVLSLADGALEHLFEVRLLLEPGAAALAAERATPDEVGDLRDCAARAEKAVDDPDAMLRLDTELHERIVRASANPLSSTCGRPPPRWGRKSRLHARLPGVSARRSASTRRSSRRSRPATPTPLARGWPRTSTASGTQRWRRLRRAARRPERPDPRVARSRRGLAGWVPSCAAGTGPRGRCAER